MQTEDKIIDEMREAADGAKKAADRKKNPKKKKKLARGIQVKERHADKGTFDGDIRRFVSLHYQTDGVHNGNVILKTRGIRHLEDGITPTPQEKVKLVGFWEAEGLAAGIAGVSLAPYNSYYITANSFTKFRPLNSQLFTFHNIVIDIDCHNWRTAAGKWMSNKELQHIMQNFVYRLETEFIHDYGIPMPNSAVYTGRGVQLWFALVPISAKCIKMYKRVAKYIMDRLEGILADHFEDFSILSIDRKASGNPAGLFRLPMTLNQSTGTYGRLDIVHEKRLDLAAFWEEVHRDAGTSCPASRPCRKEADKDEQKALADFRLAAIRKFVEIRLQDGCTMAGDRDMLAFCVYNSLIQAYPDSECIRKVLSLNASLPVPMPEHELLCYLSTSRRKAANGDPYRLTNACIIEKLGILQEERETLRIFPSGTGPSQEEKREAAREAKKERDAQILKLAQEGKNKKEVAEAVGCSPNTVSAVLRKNNVRTSSEQVCDLILSLLKKGKLSFAEIAKRTGRTVKNIREIAKKVRQRALEAKAEKERKIQEAKEKKEARKAAAAQKAAEKSARAAAEAAKKRPVTDDDPDFEYWQYLLDRYDHEAWARGSKQVHYFWHRRDRKPATAPVPADSAAVDANQNAKNVKYMELYVLRTGGGAWPLGKNRGAKEAGTAVAADGCV